MSGKLFTVGPAARTYMAAVAREVTLLPSLPLLLLAVAVTSHVGCRRPQRIVLTRPAAAAEDAIRPERFATSFRKLGRAHFRGTARFEATVDGTEPESVTTETDIWVDDRGNWRLVELNDKDGGREIVLHGHELAVALRYGKMIRRAAEDPEPGHLLQEGLGAPFAAWDLLRAVSTVDDFGVSMRAGRKVHVYKMGKADRARAPKEPRDPSDRQAWRSSVIPGSVQGTFVIDDATGTPLQADIQARYTMRRPGAGRPGSDAAAIPMHGAVEVHASVEDIGRSPPIARPEAEDLTLRQRTVPEEKALLGGLPRSAPVTPTPGVTP